MKRKQIKRIKRKVIRITSLFLAFNIMVDTIFAGAAFALTSGPSSPEFASFEPVATTNMVNTFTGDFTYNLPMLQIPGPDGGGYAMSLSYHSGANSEEEASWVGYGWTLNPGAVNRNVRGFPDDYKNAHIKQYNKMPVNWTTSGTLATGLKYFGTKKVLKKDNSNALKNELSIPATSIANNDVKEVTDVQKLKIQANYLRTLRYNSYTGLAAFYGIGGNAFGAASFNMQTGAQGTTWGFGINPMALYRNLKNEQGGLGMRYKSLQGKKWSWKRALVDEKKRTLGELALSPLSTSFAMYSFSENIQNVNVEEYDATTYSLERGITGTPGNVPVGMDVTTKGVFSIYTHKESSDETVNGYMHSTSNQDLRNDYYVEKSTPYSKRDVYLGIPFNNADQFMVNGEGIGGGFRYYQKKIGHFLPRYAKSRTKKRNLGVDFNVGVTVGVGLTIGLGDEKTEITDWKKRSAATNGLSFDEQGVFRFNGDKAGSIEYNTNSASTSNTNLSTANIGSGKTINAPEAFATHLDTEKLSNSSYIKYYKKADNAPNILGLDANVTAANSEAITGMEMTNKNGVRYTYGVPVFNRNTSNFQIDATSVNTQIGSNQFLAYRQIALGQVGDKYDLDLNSTSFSVHDYPNAKVIGEIRQLPYASNYLLTSINTPDYVDVGNDGPDAKDFGGWTKFDYHKKYGAGTGTPWYRWRIPYNGLFYDQNQNSDKKSRTGTVSTGEKEVYYLKTVETKTHIAYFVTNVSDASRWSGVVGGVDANSPYIQGSGEVRKDGLGAKHLANNNDPAAIKGANNQPVKGNERLEYLEKIVLFSKKQLDKPLQVVHFAYDYSLVQNVPNSDEGLFPRQKTKATSGKLTLKKVWFEFGGVSSGKTAPYEFVYKYKVKNEFAQEVRDEYGAIVNEMSDKHGEYAQNPDYAPYYLGPWGNIQFDGKNRKLNKMPWIDQKIRTTVDHQRFDPAAWQLKQIKLPSGGEILVQYEQKDYSFVQNRRPMTMTPLKEANDSQLILNQYSLTPSYVIDAAHLGLDPTSPDFASEIDQQVALMKDYFVTNGEKIYFKFLYNLYERGVPVLNECNSEYITGYAAVGEVKREGATGILITLSGQYDDNGRASVPRQACYDFYTTQRHGFDCEGSLSFGQHVYDNREELANGNILNSASRVNSQVDGLIAATFSETIPKKEKVGMAMSTDLSYLKIPMIKAKKGGGVRVKRLLMYDSGIENGDANLYGQEFIYEDFLRDGDGTIKQKISSGVATNEPSVAREENPLVRYLPRKGQHWYSRLTAGLDRKQFEGPLGESLLPGASIGHSRVIVQNIHKGKTGTGFSVNDYYTVKEYPYDKVYSYETEARDLKGTEEKGVDYSSLGEDRKRMSNVTIPLGLFYYSNSQTHLAQGYRFIINSMHGQIKQVASYMGTYTGQTLESVKKFAGQTYEYYEPGEKIRMLHPNGDVSWDVPGKEVDITMERRSVRNRNINADLSVDLSATFIVPPLPIYVSPSLRFEYTTQRISTHVTSKVIRYPVILKKVSAFQDGVTSESENVGFNPHTGEVILTRTTDGFHSTKTNPVKVNGQDLNGEIYALTIPASWKYPAFGRKYEKGEVKDRFNQLGLSVGSIVTYGTSGKPFQTPDKWTMDKNVLSVGFQTFKNNWATNVSSEVKAQYRLTDAEVTKALDKIWRPYQSYTYRDNVQSSDPKVNASNRIYKGGVISSITLPTSNNWAVAPPTFGNKWIASTEVTLYSPHGNALEEKNPLGIYSSARFDKEGILPTMVAGNAQYASTYFNGFEGAGFASKGHSGESHKALSNADKGLLASGGKIMKTSQLTTKGGIVKLWVHHDYDQPELKVRLRNATNGNNGETSTNEYTLAKVAQVGEWVLFSGQIAGSAFGTFAYNEFDLVVSSAFTGTLKIDDVKFQPVDAQTTCYVYDLKSLRLLTQFDDEHFGLYYQYNDEGKLIRRLIETERGMKTVQETQYNNPKKPRK